jgi:orotidine-5'-phosphate decarboxylase
MQSLNIAFDSKTPEQLIEFAHMLSSLPRELQEKICIKVNDLLALTGIEGLKILQDRILQETGMKVQWMIDGKWYDIPNTVANYAKRLEGLNVAYYTVHASG